jgi:hypothetical protein
MEVKNIKKYKGKTISQLHKLATKYFNAYIRDRDKHKGCISCDSDTFTDAGHFYSAGHFPSLRYNEMNVFGQCKRCNYFLHGNLDEYRQRITKRITPEQLESLDYEVKRYKQTGYKWDRWYLIEVIETYKNK